MHRNGTVSQRTPIGLHWTVCASDAGIGKPTQYLPRGVHHSEGEGAESSSSAPTTVLVYWPVHHPGESAAMIEWRPRSTNAEQAARDLISAAMFLHTTFKDEVWLWRGQADHRYGLEPGLHTRVKRTGGIPNSEGEVVEAAAYLISKARDADIDRVNGTRLPDLALLAHLQHYGAATPLLDVSVDPLVALWMVAFASPTAVDALDKRAGSLYAIKRPPLDRVLNPLDARPYTSNDEASISAALGDSVWWYRAPEITERLRIQRGSFLIGPLVAPDSSETTLPLVTTSSNGNWLEKRLSRRGQPSNTTRSTTDVAIFRVQGAVKRFLREILENRSGLNISTIYPTPWERPFIEEFATGYSRTRLVDARPAESEREACGEDEEGM